MTNKRAGLGHLILKKFLKLRFAAISCVKDRAIVAEGQGPRKVDQPIPRPMAAEAMTSEI
jgi:hypothetical protein